MGTLTEKKSHKAKKVSQDVAMFWRALLATTMAKTGEAVTINQMAKPLCNFLHPEKDVKVACKYCTGKVKGIFPIKGSI